MRCPGQDMQYWKPGAIFEVSCPRCGRPVEFFKDDPARTCGGCGLRFVNPQMDFGCAAWCPHAAQCLGTLPEGLAERRNELLRERVAVAVKRRYGKDFGRIGRAGRLARRAERIGRAERADLAVVLCAALLHEIGGADPAAEVRGLLADLGADPVLAALTAQAVARFASAGPDDPLEWRVLHDAWRLEARGEGGGEENGGAFRAALLTASGRDAAEEKSDPEPL